jgi:hypothetical protein
VAEFETQGIHVLSKNGGTLEFNSQLYVLPEQKLSVAVIFAGVADTTSINNTITQALLEEKGLLPGSETKEVTKPGSAAIPDQLLGFAGYYGASGSIIKVELDKQSNTLNYKQFNGSEFVSAGVYPYKDDGYFYLPSGNRMSFSESFGKKLMLQSLPTGNYGIVVGQQIGQVTNPVDGSTFANKHWLPINFSATDLSPLAVATGSISDLPGFIYVSSDSSFTPYQLKDVNSAEMTLPYARDLVEPRINEVDGKKQLTVMRYICMNTQDVSSLQNGETISIAKANENQVKKLDTAGTFNVNLPEGGRMIIYAPDLTVSYDTLFSGSESVPVAAGSYVLFIGNEGDTFSYQYSF